MSNNILDKNTFFNGLNLNPIPLEFSQSMTTTKWLLGMDKKLSTIIDKVNVWYDTLLNDINGNGILYQNIITHLDGEFLSQLEEFQTDLKLFAIQLNDIITSMELVTNIKPTVTLSLNPNQDLYNIGESINSVIVNYDIAIGNENIEKVEIYKNNILISTITTGFVNGVNTFIDGNVINSYTEYKVIVYDKYNTITSSSKKYNFVHNFYYGVVGTETINETFIKNLTGYKSLKDNLQEIFSPNDQKILYAYPTSYGDLTSIFDNEDYDVINSFSKSVVNLTLNSVQVSYNVYVSNDDILDTNIKLQFIF